jgi:hypothetical protein
MKTNPHGPLLQVENLRNLLGRQFFHIMEHKNNPQSWRDAKDRLMEEVVLLGIEQVAFGSCPDVLEKQPQFFIAW